MRRVPLCPGIQVSPLCYGTLTLGPLQKDISPTVGGRLLRYAFERGINFFDTAECYGTYSHLRLGLAGCLDEVVIASKSYADDAVTMARSVEKARRELDRDYIDIFLLHEQESEHTLRGHRGALEYLLRMKEAGVVRAVGLSTHHVAGVQAALQCPEIDIIHPLINLAGIGIADGTPQEMADSLGLAAERGIGVYAMKALAGGALFREAALALGYVQNLPGVKSLAVGMGCESEIEANVAFFTTGAFPPSYSLASDRGERRLIVEPWCEGCGECVPHCRAACLQVIENKLAIDHSRCVLCGYCVAHCRGFYLKVI
ncbi:MAG: General stress protein 69 [Firmicutes bacterium]|nr:General stress protein 69 [Bacillota bacterium]